MKTKWMSKAALVFLWAAAAHIIIGQNKPWLKPHTDWSDKDVQRILNESPWVQKQDEVPLDTFRTKTQGPKFQLVYRFLSSKPIRQALYRSIELNRKSTQAQIEAAKKFMDIKYEDSIVISVSYAGPQYPHQANLRFSKPTTGLLRNNTYLTLANGRRLYLKEYQPPGQDGLGAKFIFARLVDGKPFLGPEDRVIRFDAESLNIHNIQFKIADMILNGVLEY
jgi:hypothetical protein